MDAIMGESSIWHSALLGASSDNAFRWPAQEQQPYKLQRSNLDLPRLSISSQESNC